MRYASGLFLLLLLQGCVPRQVVVHDGLELTVVSANSGHYLADVKVLSPGVTEAGNLRVLAVSDHQGRISLLPETSIKWVPLFSEAKIFLDLWVCKPGFAMAKVAQRGGWNADLRPPEIHRPGKVELAPALKSGGCGLNA